MRFSHSSFCVALLSSAVAVIALTPAHAAIRSDASKRMLALHGNRTTAAHSVGAKSQRNAAKAKYTVLHDFAGSPNDGANSGATVIFDDAGNIYGTTDGGGANGDGTVFQLSPKGKLSLLHSFNGSDGSAPDGAVTLAPTGEFYGSTGSGGASGNGVLFSLSSKGKYKVLHDFSSNDGSFIRGHLERDQQGNYYGTALFGGINGDGTVFKYSNKGRFTVLHAFNGTDGEFPEHGVVADDAGNIYGVTAFGGASDEGTVFKIAADGTFSTLYSFTGGADGGFLYGTLDIGKDGNLYGSTVDGGANNAGTVFKMTTDGKLTTLYNFTGGADGGGPEGDMLVVGKNLYSTNTTGGDPDCQCGVVYEVTSKGNAKVLHAFDGLAGACCSGGLATGSRRYLAGTTSGGGANGDGVVFSISTKK